MCVCMKIVSYQSSDQQNYGEAQYHIESDQPELRVNRRIYNIFFCEVANMHRHATSMWNHVVA